MSLKKVVAIIQARMGGERFPGKVLHPVAGKTSLQHIVERIRVSDVVNEIMIATPAVRNLIREGKTFQIPSTLQTGKKYGMQTLDDSIMGLLKKKAITPDDAYMKAEEKSKFLPYLKNPPSDFTEV